MYIRSSPRRPNRDLNQTLSNKLLLLIITKIAFITSLVLILIGGKPIIKSITNSNMGPYGIESTNTLLYKQCLDIYTL